MPMWSKPERATGGSYFAAFATHGTPCHNYKRIARPAAQKLLFKKISTSVRFDDFFIEL